MFDIIIITGGQICGISNACYFPIKPKMCKHVQSADNFFFLIIIEHIYL